LEPFSFFWRALKAGVDGMPPTYYLLVRISRMIPGHPQVTLRLPSIVGYLMTLGGSLLVCAEKTAGDSRFGSRPCDNAFSVPRIGYRSAILLFGGGFPRDIRWSCGRGSIQLGS